MIIQCKVLYKEVVAGMETKMKESDLALCLEDVSAFSAYPDNPDLSVAFLNGKELLIKTPMGHKKLVSTWNLIRRNDKHIGQLN